MEDSEKRGRVVVGTAVVVLLLALALVQTAGAEAERAEEDSVLKYRNAELRIEESGGVVLEEVDSARSVS